MTIPHADLIRAVLDGKTVRYGVPEWVEYSGLAALENLIAYPNTAWHLKPEPRCVWTEHWGSWRDEVRNYSPRATVGRTILRHEFDPDTGEYLRTVKEGDSNA